MARKPLLTEAELKLPEYLQTYTGYGDDHGNYKWSERAWRTERNKWLGRLTPKPVHMSYTESLMRENIAVLNAIHADAKCKAHHDQVRAVGTKLEVALAKLLQDNANRARAAAEARGKITYQPKGRPKKVYAMWDGNGNGQIVTGLAEVARLAGTTATVVSTRLSQGGGKAWLGQRDPEHSWTVARLPDDPLEWSAELKALHDFGTETA